MTEAATHHGPWCDEDPPEYACPACTEHFPRPGGAPTPVGGWLLLRLVRYHAAGPVLASLRQEPLTGLEPSSVDRLELARLTLALAEAGWKA